MKNYVTVISEEYNRLKPLESGEKLRYQQKNVKILSLGGMYGTIRIPIETIKKVLLIKKKKTPHLWNPLTTIPIILQTAIWHILIMMMNIQNGHNW